jgi:uracil phosphoribosyltransferase
MVIILQGAALSQDLTIVRDSSTPTPQFRSAVRRIGLHLAAECSKHLPTSEVSITTPLEKTIGFTTNGQVVIIPVLRAGIGLLDPFLDLLPGASVGFQGLQRDERTLAPSEYYHNFPPPNENSTYIVIDPMVATGGSMSATLSRIRERNPHKIIAASLIAAPVGIARVMEDHPEVTLVIAAEDRGLDNMGFIVPGLGDAGDRLFGTS